MSNKDVIVMSESQTTYAAELERQQLIKQAHSLVAAIANRPGATKLLKGVIPTLEMYTGYKQGRRQQPRGEVRCNTNRGNLTSTTQALCFWLPGVVVPKARPRVTKHGTYFPERYREWRQMAETEVLVSLSPTERASLPIPRAEVLIQLQGKHRGDLDNLAGSCLDALVSANVLVDDRIACVPRLVIEHQPVGTCGVSVEVRSLT